jgi:hypothetical protein
LFVGAIGIPYNIWGKNNIRVVGNKKKAMPDTKCAGFDSMAILDTGEPKSMSVNTK